MAQPFVLQPRLRRVGTGGVPTLFRYSVAQDGVSFSKYGGTFTRADASTCATYVDVNGVVQTVAANIPRIQYTGGIPGLLLEGGRINVCLQSEDFTATWAAVSTPTLTAAADTSTNISLSLVNDTSNTLVQGYEQTVTFTGDAVKAVSVFIKQGTSTSAYVRLRDNTASADRLLAVITWSAGLPVITMTTGTSYGYQTLANGVFRLLLASTAVTAANTNVLRLLAASDAAGSGTPTGTTYFGGVMCENAAFPGSYLKTTTTAVTRATEVDTFPWTAAQGATTIYMDMIDRDISAAGTSYPCIITDAAGAGTFFAQIAATSYRANHYNGTNTRASDSTVAVVNGQHVETRTVIQADGSVIGGAAINGGAETAGAASATNAFVAFTTPTLLQIGAFNSGASGRHFLELRSIKIAASVQSLLTMRGA